MTAHPMVVFSRPVQDRAAVTTWVREAVAAGERVVLRVTPGVSQADAPDVSDVATLFDELVGAGVDPTVFGSGQIQFLDAVTLGAVTGGRHRALRGVFVELVEQARRAGYTGLAVTSDASALRACTCDEREMRAHERDLDRLTRQLPLRVLCRYRSGEHRDLLAGMAAVHHRATSDVLWAAELVQGSLVVRGEIDVTNADRFAAVLHAARLEGTRCVELSELRFCSAAGLGVFARAAASSPPHRPLVLRNPRPSLTRLLRLFGLEGTGLRIEFDASDPGGAPVPPRADPDRPRTTRVG